MAETRSKAKAKAKGTEGSSAPVTNSNFISVLYKKYKPCRSYKDSDITQYFPCAKKSKTSKDLVAQSPPLPMKSNQSNHMNLGNKYEFETKTEEKEDPFSMECSTKEKKLDNTMSQNQTVNEDQINTEAFLVPQRDDIFEISEAINEFMTEEEIIITDSLKNNGSVEDESSEDPVRKNTVQEVQAVDSMQPNSSGENINSANEKSVCSCSLRINKSRENLVKISGELKNISDIIENIKKELEKHTK